MVEYKSKTFVGIVATILIANVVVGIANLLVVGNLIYIPTILLSGMILVLMYRKDEYLVMCIKIWAGLFTLGGFAGLVSNGCAYVHVAAGGTEFGPDSYAIGTILVNFLFLGFGLYFFFYCDEYIVKVRPMIAESAVDQTGVTLP